MIKTLEQERAEFAYKVIKEISETEENLQKDYKSLVKKSPTLILTSGLIQTLAYYLAKAETSPEQFKLSSLEELIKKGKFIDSMKSRKNKVKAHSLLYLHLVAWLTYRGFGDLENLLNAQAYELSQATKEALALLNWMKRFADAMLKGEET